MKSKAKHDARVERNARIREIMHKEDVSYKEARAILLHREMMANVEDFGDK
jgi:hypothetical protein